MMVVEPDHSLVDEGVVRALVSGEIDPATAPRLAGEVQALVFTGAPRELVIDLSGVTFIDSTGLRAVIEIHNLMRDRGGKLVLENPSEKARRILDITGLTEHLELR
jgi:anti-sigma B factor antagonist